MTVYMTSDGRELSFREWALEKGYCEPANDNEMLRVVETGFLGTETEVEAYLKGLGVGKLIEQDKFPAWEHEDTEVPYSDEPAADHVVQQTD